MPTKLPGSPSSHGVGRIARAQVHAQMTPEYWIFREFTGGDYGVDCVLELTEKENATNNKIEGQIKGRSEIEPMKRENAISFSLEIQTINYALNSPIAFVLFLANTTTRKIYYLPIQDYFIANPTKFTDLEVNKKTVQLHIPLDNIVCEYNDYDLQQIAKSKYTFDEDNIRTLKKL